MVETNEAIFFESTTDPQVIFYFPKLDTFAGPAQAFPGSDEWQASLVYKNVNQSDPGAVQAPWAGKILRPYVFTPTSECQLRPVAGMTSIRQTVSAEGRDLSPADSLPACQFFFRLRSSGKTTSGSGGEGADVNAAAASGTLIGKPGKLVVPVVLDVPWTGLHQALISRSPSGSSIKDTTEAAFLVGIATGSDSRALALIEHLSVEQKSSFVQAAIGKLFEPTSQGGLTPSAIVTGSFSTQEAQSYDL